MREHLDSLGDEERRKLDDESRKLVRFFGRHLV
jgi:hypothetical protein